MVTINIDIISDIVCVWCYIGKRTLSRTISIYQKTYPGGKNDTFVITWRPYYLNHNPSAQSVDKAELTKVKLADWSPEKIAAATNRVNQVGRSVGINFKNGGKIGSTREAHRLIHLSQVRHKKPEIQDALVEGIFRAYHEQERDISGKDVLREIAVEAGLDALEVDGWLSSDEGRLIVDDEASKNRSVVAAGVPFFIIQGKYHIDGAQDPQDFLEAFIKVREGENTERV